MAIYMRGGVWWYEFEFQGRRVRASSYQTNKTAAMRTEAKRKTDLLERRAGFSKKKLAPKFDDQVKEFLAWSAINHRPKTTALHKTNCDTLLRFFKGKWLDEITSSLVEQFKQTRIGEARRNAKDGSAITGATVNRALTTLKRLYNHAEHCGFDVSNPTRGVHFFNEGSGRMRVVSFTEELAYLDAASQPLKDIARIILDTGLRPEEVFRIRTEYVDFGTRTIFNPFGKTKAARRQVTMTAEVYGLLKDRAKQARGPYVFAARGNSDLPIGTVRKAHYAAIRKAAIQDRFRLYDLRHTFATRAAAAGVDLPTLSSILGHTNVTMTMRYVHPGEEQKRLAICKLERFRLDGMVRAAAEKSQGVPTESPTVN
jgi:integrase